MKKLMSIIFSLLFALSVAGVTYAAEEKKMEEPAAKEKPAKEKKMKKAKKAKKAKKEKKEDKKDEMAPEKAKQGFTIHCFQKEGGAGHSAPPSSFSSGMSTPRVSCRPLTGGRGSIISWFARLPSPPR